MREHVSKGVLMYEPLPHPAWGHDCCTHAEGLHGVEVCPDCGTRGWYIGLAHRVDTLMARFLRIYGVIPRQSYGEQVMGLLGGLRTPCIDCRGVGYVGDASSCTVCRPCEGSGGHWTASNAEIRSAYAELRRVLPHALAGSSLPVDLLPEHLSPIGDAS
jgi:hypothetical protein